ncbi:MAG: pantetheine-phosphate adenylyltransferase [Candidatus Dormibacteria bacterium]
MATPPSASSWSRRSPEPLKSAVYAGSFDPVTLAHIDVLERAVQVFDRVTVAVAVNSQKSPLFSAEERIEMLRECLAGEPRVDVDAFEGLTVDYARQRGAQSLIRGLRAISDFDGEFQMALMNRKLAPEIITVFLMTSFANVYLSSTMIKEICRLGGDIEAFVPAGVARRLREKLPAGGVHVAEAAARD